MTGKPFRTAPMKDGIRYDSRGEPMTPEPQAAPEPLTAALDKFVDTSESVVLVMDGNHVRAATDLELTLRDAARASQAAPVASGALDIERLARAMASDETQSDPSHDDTRKAHRIAAEYARLAAHPDTAGALVEFTDAEVPVGPDRDDEPRSWAPDTAGEPGERDFGIEIELGEALNSLLAEAAASGIGLDAVNRRDLARILAAPHPDTEPGEET